MNVRELIAKLSDYDPELPVMVIVDGQVATSCEVEFYAATETDEGQEFSTVDIVGLNYSKALFV